MKVEGNEETVVRSAMTVWFGDRRPGFEEKTRGPRPQDVSQQVSAVPSSSCGDALGHRSGFGPGVKIKLTDGRGRPGPEGQMTKIWTVYADSDCRGSR